MRAFLEAGVFTGLAVAVHIGLVLSLQGQDGAEASGTAGEALVSIAAARESFAALADAWQRPPEMAAAHPAPDRPDAGRLAGLAPSAPHDAAAPEVTPRPATPERPTSETAPPAPGPVMPGLAVGRPAAPVPAGSPRMAARAPEPEPRLPPRSPAAPSSPAGGEVALPAVSPQLARDATHAAMLPTGQMPAGDGEPVPQASPDHRIAPQPAGHRPPAPDLAPPPAADTSPPPPLVVIETATAGQARPAARPESETVPPTERLAETPSASPDAAPQPAQTARGAGEGAAAGERAAAPAATLSQAERQSHLASWGGTIRARVNRQKSYPASLRQRRVTGTATVRLEVARNGRLLQAGISVSSGHPALDEAALDAVRHAGRFPAAPTALREAAFRFDLPVRFSQ
jgi:periplasmic protein TonB